jgi:hypothetical protein
VILGNGGNEIFGSAAEPTARKGLANQAFGADGFRGFLKRKIRDWIASMERFIFWAISRGFIPEVSILRNISSSVIVQGRPAGRGPVISPSL